MTPPSWINKGQPKADWPEWLRGHSVGRPDANGSFLIRTIVGKEPLQARVHRGAMVYLWQDVAYTCHPSEARDQLAALEQASAPPPPPDPRPVTTQPPAKPPRFAAPKGMPPSIENRHPSELRIDDSYQRSIDTGPSRSLIKAIAENWDWRMCMPLVVSKRDDGSLYVIDGQHRLAGALMRGDIPFLPCCVAVYGGVADEAAMFVAMNRSRRAMNRLDDFHAAQAGGDKESLQIAALIEGVGFTVSRKTGSHSWVPGEVAFTSAIAKFLRKHGEAVVRKALQMMADAFPDERLNAGSSVFAGLCKILVAPPEDFAEDRLFKALLTFDMKGWASFLTGAKGGDDRERLLRDMLLEAYADAGKAEVAA